MKKFALVVAASAMVAAVPAWAAKPAHPTHPTHPSHPAGWQNGDSQGKDKRKSCITGQQEGYNASGTLVSGTLTPGTKSDRFSGTLTVDIKRANHNAPTGSQPFTLTNARVHFGKGVTATTLAPGDHVALHGKITVLPHGCPSTGMPPVITIRYVRISAPKSH